MSAVVALLFSLYLWLQVDQIMGLFMGVWVGVILCFGIYMKLLRIVHFVLYKNLNKDEESDG
jgi:hypothetical protein